VQRVLIRSTILRADFTRREVTGAIAEFAGHGKKISAETSKARQSAAIRRRPLRHHTGRQKLKVDIIMTPNRGSVL
jgi:hypothetical protein